MQVAGFHGFGVLKVSDVFGEVVGEFDADLGFGGGIAGQARNDG